MPREARKEEEKAQSVRLIFTSKASTPPKLYRHHLKAEDYDAAKEDWREEKMRLITKQLPILINKITSNSLTCTEVNTSIVEKKVNALRQLLPTVSPTRANAERAATVETNHISLAQKLLVKEPVSCAKKDVPDAGNQVTRDGDSNETQHKVQDDPRHQHFPQGKISTPETGDTASYPPRPAFTLPETPPPVENPDDMGC